MIPRVVLDTNVLVSALVWKGHSQPVLDALEARQCQLVLSWEILAEYVEVLDREPFRGILAGRGESPRELLSQVLQSAELVSSTSSPMQVVADPDDEMFIAAAVTGNADAIVSGDRHLLDLKEVADIPILTPRRFLNWLKKLPRQ